MAMMWWCIGGGKTLVTGGRFGGHRPSLQDGDGSWTIIVSRLPVRLSRTTTGPEQRSMVEAPNPPRK